MFQEIYDFIPLRHSDPLTILYSREKELQVNKLEEIKVIKAACELQMEEVSLLGFLINFQTISLLRALS